jgi:hypothetical protein
MRIAERRGAHESGETEGDGEEFAGKDAGFSVSCGGPIPAPEPPGDARFAELDAFAGDFGRGMGILPMRVGFRQRAGRAVDLLHRVCDGRGRDSGRCITMHGLEAHATFRDDHFTQGASDGVVIRFGEAAADG